MNGRNAEYLKFWTELANEFALHSSPVKLAEAKAQNWISGSIGRPGYSVAFAVNHRKADGIVAALEIVNREAAFEILRESAAEIADELGEKLVWEKLQTKCRVAIYHHAEFGDVLQRQEIRKWFRKKAADLHRVFTR